LSLEDIVKRLVRFLQEEIARVQWGPKMDVDLSGRAFYGYLLKAGVEQRIAEGLAPLGNVNSWGTGYMQVLEDNIRLIGSTDAKNLAADSLLLPTHNYSDVDILTAQVAVEGFFRGKDVDPDVVINSGLARFSEINLDENPDLYLALRDQIVKSANTKKGFLSKIFG
jgi:hypothetical protein